MKRLRGLLLVLPVLAGATDFTNSPAKTSTALVKCKATLGQVMDLVEASRGEAQWSESTIREVVEELQSSSLHPLTEEQKLALSKGLEYEPLLRRNVVFRAIANQFTKKGLNSKNPQKVKEALLGFRLLSRTEQAALVDGVYNEMLSHTVEGLGSSDLKSVGALAKKAGMSVEEYVNFASFWGKKLRSEPEESKNAIYIMLADSGHMAPEVAKHIPGLPQRFLRELNAFFAPKPPIFLEPMDSAGRDFAAQLERVRPLYKVGSEVRSQNGKRAIIKGIRPDGNVSIWIDDGWGGSLDGSVPIQNLALTDLSLDVKGYRVGMEVRTQNGNRAIIKGIRPDGNVSIWIDNIMGDVIGNVPISELALSK